MATTRHDPRGTLPTLTLTSLLLLVLTACGAPSTDPPAGSTGPVTTTIDRTGGTLEARGEDGTRRRLLDATTDALTLYTPALGATIDDLWPYLEALLVHAATVDITGATCPTRPELDATLDTVINRYADAYPTRIANLDTDIWRLV